ncbi:uncharacterized protein LOC133866284 [Alnus glutinosa]|uniref:uncharacterized protein LOC133866284 n=1 Tax=Alnus glutinosa TaxID=3517 RepID=UPI002D76E30A|nr:uncharacterized protein LOC133866284 [Alnus glutinosa]
MVGDGSSIFLWFDNWHPAGCLFDTYGSRVMYDAGPSIGPMLSSIIRDGDWYWTSVRSEALVDIQSRLPKVILGEVDKAVWDSKNGEFSSSETWEKLRVAHSITNWHKIVWFPASIPKHSFVLWLVFHGALITKEKMCSWGFNGNISCLFCHACVESRDHLFFSCGFSRRIWYTIMRDCSIPYPPVEWDDIEDWCGSVMKGDNFYASLRKLYFGAAVYHLWRQRNLLLHGETPLTEERIISKIRWEVKTRMVYKFPSKSPCNHR